MPSRRLLDLHPELQPLARSFLTSCGKRLTTFNVEIIVTCTYRSNAEQAELYAIGRTKPGKVVTKAQPGESAHNVTLPDGTPASCAFDIVPLRHGKPIWGTEGNGIDDDPSDDVTDDLELWQNLGKIGRDCGLEWAGDWKSFREFPHFQLPDWKNKVTT